MKGRKSVDAGIGGQDKAHGQIGTGRSKRGDLGGPEEEQKVRDYGDPAKAKGHLTQAFRVAREREGQGQLEVERKVEPAGERHERHRAIEHAGWDLPGREYEMPLQPEVGHAYKQAHHNEIPEPGARSYRTAVVLNKN